MKKTTLFILCALVSSPTWALDLRDMGRPTGHTPYDQYFDSVKAVLAQGHRRVTLDQVNELMLRGRNFQYRHTTPYRPHSPAVTEADRAGDCKDKALWLADRLGAANVRFAVGKPHDGSKKNHAFLLWNDGADWWVLDPTTMPFAVRADQAGSKDWVVLYSYTGTTKYLHPAAQWSAVQGNARSPIAEPLPTPASSRASRLGLALRHRRTCP
jgi:hypothetical protein